MEQQNDTRSQILTTGRRLTAQQGYTGVGLSSLLKEAGVPKGSFYHYFASKEAYGCALLEEFMTEYGTRLNASLAHPDMDARSRVFTYFERWRTKQLSPDPVNRCLVVKLSAEVADLSADMSIILQKLVSDILTHLARTLEQGADDGTIALLEDPRAGGVGTAIDPVSLQPADVANGVDQDVAYRPPANQSGSTNAARTVNQGELDAKDGYNTDGQGPDPRDATEAGGASGTGPAAPDGVADVGATQADLQGIEEGSTDPLVFDKAGWAVVSATQDWGDNKFGPAHNTRAAEALRAELLAKGIFYLEQHGFYKGDPDGTTFLILADTSTARKTSCYRPLLGDLIPDLGRGQVNQRIRH